MPSVKAGNVLRLGIAAIVKDEADALLEWIAFHRVVGVSHFLMADNDSQDGTSELLAALQTQGIVTHIPFPTVDERKPQMPAYARVLRSYSAAADLLAFIDADEFILPMEGADSLLPLLETLFLPKDVGAVALNWANFGSSGELFAKPGLVIERFTKRAGQNFGPNHHYKTVVRPQWTEFFENPHHARLRKGRYVDALGNDLTRHPKHGHGLSAEVVWSGARVNHYVVKSLEEFLCGKSTKGSASLAGRVKHQSYFERHDRNEEICELAQRFGPRVKEEIVRLEELIKPVLDDWAANEAPASRRWQRAGWLPFAERWR